MAAVEAQATATVAKLRRPFSMVVESWVRGESAEQKEGNGGGGCGAAPEILDWLWSSQATQCASFFRAGGRGGCSDPLPRALG